MTYLLLDMFQSAPDGREGFKLAPSDFFWTPPQASTLAEETDFAFDVLVWMSLVCTIAIVWVMAHLVIKYRAKSRAANERPEPSSDHNTMLEVGWSVAPLFFVIWIFVVGFKGFVNLRTSPADSYDIHVTGQKWKWLFTYPNGLVMDELHVPADKNVRAIIDSVDVLHSFWIPAFRVKIDAVPGRFTELWFNANAPGEYVIECAEYCGTSHSDMLAKVVVHEPGGFESWLEEEEKKIDLLPPAELGQLMYERQGCKTCHSTDGSPLTGPSFKGLFGRQETMSDGTAITVDENYIQESILEPQAKVVQGFPPSMPTFKGKLNDKKIKGIIAYIKTLK